MSPYEEEAALDLSEFRPEEWAAFLFDHPDGFRLIKSGTEYEDYVISDPLLVLNGIRYVLENFKSVGETYSLAQIDHGIWALWSGELNLKGLLFDERIDWPIREATIRSMAIPFRDFLAGHPIHVMENCFFMWWHLIRVPGGYERRLRDAYFETLREILSINDDRCQGAALHGLGHLRHPGRFDLIGEYIDKHAELLTDPDGLHWVEQCQIGTVM
ncbi:hypothetical protein EON81_22985 [bacterium]|nr:MAG: hypothetical protein EON81_22985 [bacterium]